MDVMGILLLQNEDNVTSVVFVSVIGEAASAHVSVNAKTIFSGAGECCCNAHSKACHEMGTYDLS